MEQRTDPYRDVTHSSIGFWTDNGGYYHYATGEANATYDDVLPKATAFHGLPQAIHDLPRPATDLPRPSTGLPLAFHDLPRPSIRYEDVLPKVKSSHEAAGVPFRHWQFDSWFYPKDAKVGGGPPDP